MNVEGESTANWAGMSIHTGDKKHVRSVRQSSGRSRRSPEPVAARRRPFQNKGSPHLAADTFAVAAPESDVWLAL